MKSLILVVLSLAITACNVGYNPRYYYNAVQVANLTGDTLRDLKVQVGPDGRTIECAEVTDKRICDERFGRRPYPQALVEISWRNSDGQQSIQQVNPAVPLTMVPSLPIRLMLDIGADGAVKAYFQQDEYKLGRMPLSMG
jgi:hypothetical protein